MTRNRNGTQSGPVAGDGRNVLANWTGRLPKRNFSRRQSNGPADGNPCPVDTPRPDVVGAAI